MPYHPKDTLLDKYRLEALIGRGAFAEVYRARHLALNAARALKILRNDAPGWPVPIYRWRGLML